MVRQGAGRERQAHGPQAFKKALWLGNPGDRPDLIWPGLLQGHMAGHVLCIATQPFLPGPGRQQAFAQAELVLVEQGVIQSAAA